MLSSALSEFQKFFEALWPHYSGFLMKFPSEYFSVTGFLYPQSFPNSKNSPVALFLRYSGFKMRF